MNARRSTAALATALAFTLGCGRVDAPNLDPADTLTLLEGLPHPANEPGLFAAEKASGKPTVERDGHLFYRDPLALSAADARELRAALGDPATYAPFSGEKRCGGFHPDYGVEWSRGGKARRVLLCFGCHEAKVVGPVGVKTFDLSPGAFARLKAVLGLYRKDRPEPGA